jgi:hypothetical protein
MAAFPNSQIVENAGAVHGAEISLVWGTMTNTPMASGIPNTANEEELSKKMRHVWAEFAKDPVHGLEKLGYPQYDPRNDSLVRLGNQNKGMIDLVPGAMYDKSCPDPNAPPSKGTGLLSSLSGLFGFGKGSPAKGPMHKMGRRFV